jgi:hypothetical protein
MKEKLVEEWLIRARERGGIDHAYSQWLVSEGHEVLRVGHSPTEFGKDIISIAPDGCVHVYQIKDEDIALAQLRDIHAQLVDLVEVYPSHPRIIGGLSVSPHLITSGIINEVAAQRIDGMNDSWRARGLPTLDIVGRNELISRFVTMSDAFWPEKPKDIRDFFSFYLAEGKGDFAPKKFSAVLIELLPPTDRPSRRSAQRLAAVGLLGNYLLNAFEREGDHWSLFQGWTMIAAHQAWYAVRVGLPNRDWKGSFHLAVHAASKHLEALFNESTCESGFVPSDLEIDDYTRARNLILASVIAAHALLHEDELPPSLHERLTARLEMLLDEDRLFIWGEGAFPNLLCVQWYLARRGRGNYSTRILKAMLVGLCSRNHKHSDDQPLAHPLISPDDVLSELFQPDQKPTRDQAPVTWTLEPTLHILARRNDFRLMERLWRRISHLEMVSFSPEPAVDMLLWESPRGREFSIHPQDTQSKSELAEAALAGNSTFDIPLMIENPSFALMYLLAYPHRASASLTGFLDAHFCAASFVATAKCVDGPV